MITFVVLKRKGRPPEEAEVEILGVFHTRSQAINAARVDCGEHGPADCDDWTHCWSATDGSYFFMSYQVSRHKVPRAAFTKIVTVKAKR